MKNKPCKYTAGQTVWTVLDCDHVECTILKTGNNIVGDPEYLVEPIRGNGHFENTYWTAEDRLYDNELDAVKESLRLWDNKHKKAVEDADYILSHKLAYLSLRKSELEEQQRKSLDNQTLTNGYYQVPTDKCYSSVTVKGAAKLGVIGGMVEDLHIYNGGIVHLQSGRLESATAYKRAQLTVEGGYVHSASIAGGSLCVVGRSGTMPYVNQAVVNDGGYAYLCSAIGSGFWIREPKSKLRIGSGATMIETIIGSGGEVMLDPGASMSSCTVCSGGTLTYGDDVAVNDLTINNGGIVRYVDAV